MRLSVLLAWLLVVAAPVAAQTAALSVSPGSREEVRQFYRAVYHASEGVPMDWTGSYASGAPGDTSAAFKEATRLRINFFRALAGVPADIDFQPGYSEKAQHAALMMSANNALQHEGIPPSWTFYSAPGAEAAANSNLALGSAGPAAIDAYIADSGASNFSVGHRRWLLFPQTLRMGTGDVPGAAAFPTANAVWVLDLTPGGEFNALRPVTRATEIAYPPAGFIPHQLVWPRWSFSHPGADFSAATVTMTRNGQLIAVAPEPLLDSPAGESTLVWIYDGKDADDNTPHSAPATDDTYTVVVDNVRIAGATRSFSYDVTVFDPDVPGADARPVAISGSVAPAARAATPYAVTMPAFSSAFDWRTLHVGAAAKTYTAENGLDGLFADTTPGYDVVQSRISAAGGFAYRLAHLPARGDEVLLFPGEYLAAANSAVLFQSRLAIATAIETARVQVSTDEGRSWIDIYRQAGTSPTNTGFPAATENAFSTRSISLAAYAGRTIEVRLVYSIEPAGTAFLPEPENNVGWFIDTLALTNVQSVTGGPAARITEGSTFALTPATPGAFALQARGVMFDEFPLEWGTVMPVIAIEGSDAAGDGYLSNISVRSTAGADAQTLIVGFSISGGTKPLLVRGIGPELRRFDVPGVLADPKLELFGAGGLVGTNDSWNPSAAASFDIAGAFPLAAGSADAVIVESLGAGNYTTHVSGNGATGVALIELYDFESGGEARLTNISARSHVGTGSNILIAGFTVSGAGSRTLLIRAIGPTLNTDFSIEGALADPKLAIRDSGTTPTLIAENDNWDSASTAAAFGRVGAFPLPAGSRDAVLLVNLPPGGYTVQVSGAMGETGVALVEIYEVP